MTAETVHYYLWVNWDSCEVSETAIEGFEKLTFCSPENCKANLKLLIQSGFHMH